MPDHAPHPDSPAYLPGHIRNVGVFVLSPRMKPCKFCGDPVMTYNPTPICRKAECQEKKAARPQSARLQSAKVKKQRYEAARRPKS